MKLMGIRFNSATFPYRIPRILSASVVGHHIGFFIRRTKIKTKKIFKYFYFWKIMDLINIHKIQL